MKIRDIYLRNRSDAAAASEVFTPPLTHRLSRRIEWAGPSGRVRSMFVARVARASRAQPLL